MSIGDARIGLGLAERGRRLLELDDLWTFSLRTPASLANREEIIDLGQEMLELLRQLPGDVATAREWILRDNEALSLAAENAIRGAALDDDTKGMIRDAYAELGWADEVAIALRYIEQGSGGEANDLSGEVEALRSGSTSEGDLREWFRCTLRVAIFGTTIASALAATAMTGGTALPLALSLGSAVLGLADGLPGCRGDLRRSPSDADELEKLARLHSRGDLSDAEFRDAKRRLLGQEAHEVDDLEKELEVFRKGLPYPIKVPKPLVFKKPPDGGKSKRD